MLTYTSKRSNRERTVDVDVHGIMQARMDGKGWGEIYYNFGPDSKKATLTDVRRSLEWATEAVRFAESGGYDVNVVLSRVRGGLSPTPTDVNGRRNGHPPTPTPVNANAVRRVASGLTHDEFAEIRQRRANGESQQRIADEMNMSRGGVIRALGLIGEMEENGEFGSPSAADQTLDTASAVLASCGEFVEALQSLVAEIHRLAGE